MALFKALGQFLSITSIGVASIFVSPVNINKNDEMQTINSNVLKEEKLDDLAPDGTSEEITNIDSGSGVSENSIFRNDGEGEANEKTDLQDEIPSGLLTPKAEQTPIQSTEDTGEIKDSYENPSIQKTEFPNSKNDNSNDNWFSIKLGDSDTFDDYDWRADECQVQEVDSKVTLQCPWEYTDPHTTIIFSIYPDTNPALKVQNWEDLTELSMRQRGDEAAELGLTFSGKAGEIEIFLTRKHI